MKESSRDSFKNSFGVLVAMAGSAVGLGNLWRFPYLLGEHGGAAFIIVYLIAVFFICAPIFIAEFLVGRRAQSDTFGSFKILAPGSGWSIIGVFAIIAVVCILSFYSVVGGWSVQYFCKAVTFDFTRGSSEHLDTLFSGFVSDPYKPIIFHTIFLILTSVIVIAGVRKGIESFTKVMMPVLFLIVILIAIRSVTLPGASEGLNYLFKPDFSKIDSSTLLIALGQAFFSLSIGCGTIITYGSYVKKEASITKCATGTVISDTLFALIAGCAIMPAVFSFGISPGEGPGLVFITLPHIFSQMPLGGVVAILFFATLLLAALTSSISLLEVVVAHLTERHNISRKKAVILSFGLFWVLGALCSLSQGVLSDFKIAGLNIFDLFDYISANIFMLACGFLIVIFVGWKLKGKVIKEELTNNGALKISPMLVSIIIFLIKYIAPLAVITIVLAKFNVF